MRSRGLLVGSWECCFTLPWPAAYNRIKTYNKTDKKLRVDACTSVLGILLHTALASCLK
jgi:hypothetical protein